MLNKLTTKKIFAFCLLAIPSLGVAQHRAAVGPLDNVEIEQSRLTVLGQTFSISGATQFAINGKPVASAQGTQALATGRSIYVEGIDLAERTVATSVSISDDGYVPGASSVYVFGRVADVSSATGILRIGTLSVDSAAVAPELLAKIKVGSAVEIYGIQPLPGGKLVELDQLSIGGSGSQLLSIGGSGIQLQSIGGSGKRKQSIGGSGGQSLSIGGTGVQRQSIGGSGQQQQSIGETGVQLQSIGGSGVQIQSIGGTGIR